MEKGAQTAPAKAGSKIPMLQNTPTKFPKTVGTFSPPDFQFTFRHASLELSPDAKKLMNETREEAAKIRAQMSAEGSTLPSIREQVQRKIATPKGKAGRFSDVHMTEFKKMDSIANHPSSFRADPNRLKQGDFSLKRSGSNAELDKSEPSAAKNLKRSKSKAEIDEAEEANGNPKPTEFKIKTSGLEACSPAKRFKARYEDDTTATRPISRGQDGSQSSKFLHLHESSHHLPAAATTPTKSSIARTEHVKSVKSGIPSLVRSLSKPSVTGSFSKKTSTTSFVAQSPSKKDVSPRTEPGKDPSSLPLLARSPSKKPTGQHSSTEDCRPSTPLLSRSPSKKPVNKASSSDNEEQQAQSTPLLSRSPSKKALPSEHKQSDQPGQSSNVPLLSRTPAKIPVSEDSPFKQWAGSANTPAAPSSSLRNRFSALRGASSAMKSILRAPQRLYSDDPFKIAAGTHIAVGTPPRSVAKATENEEAPFEPSHKKQVDFDNSPTVERRVIGSPSPIKTRSNAADKMDVTYPSLPSRSPLFTEASSGLQTGIPNMGAPHKSVDPEEAKAVTPLPSTATAPGTFTFRVGNPITFGPTAATPQSPASMKPTIRHVRPSIAPPSSRRTNATTGATSNNGKGKKRKYSSSEGEDEGKENVATATPGALSVFDLPDDDDSEEKRPAKKLRFGDGEGEKGDKSKAKGEQKKVKTATRLPTTGGAKTGVKAGTRKRTSGILSQARLNLLATPKKRRGE